MWPGPSLFPLRASSPTCASPPVAGLPAEIRTPGLGGHAAALEATRRPASKGRSTSAGTAGRLWVAVDGHPHTLGLSWEAAAPPTQAQGAMRIEGRAPFPEPRQASSVTTSERGSQQHPHALPLLPARSSGLGPQLGLVTRSWSGHMPPARPPTLIFPRRASGPSSC